MRALIVWGAIAAATLTPIAIASTSPFLAARAPVYIIGGFAGIAALSLLLIQPLLAAGLLPLTKPKARKLHRALGIALIALTALHIVGLYLTSPPDTLDALLLVSPTPFSIYGVAALWAVIATAVLVLYKRRLRPPTWEVAHNALAVIITISTVIHALMIQGAMGETSKWILCVLVIVASLTATIRMRILKPLAKPG